MKPESYLKAYYALFFVYILLSLYNTATLPSVISEPPAINRISSITSLVLFVSSIILVVKLIKSKEPRIKLVLPVYHIGAYISAIVIGIWMAFSSISSGMREMSFPDSLRMMGYVMDSLAMIILLLTIYFVYIMESSHNKSRFKRKRSK
mgnify:CR=1 FL=1